MQRTLCDWCTETNDANFRVAFQRLVADEGRSIPEATADRSIDLCRKHYDELWEFIKTKGAPRYGPR